MEADFITVANAMLAENERSFNLPFPMGVFGTLRRNWCNHSLMQRGKITSFSLAFMPNFVAEGLSIRFEKGASAPFEIYYYHPEEWQRMIGAVDRLESFSPNDSFRSYGYYRTLAYLHCLPANFEHPLFTTNLKKQNYYEKRNLEVPTELWNNYPKVPCWVYSNKRNNELCNGYPIIWG